MEKRFVTYTLSRPFFGMNIPIPIQSLYLREYAKRTNLNFSLPITEVCFGKSYYSLSNIFRNLTKNDHFGAVSLMVLPLTDDELFNQLASLIKDKNTILHFPLEDFVGNLEKIFEWKSDFQFMKNISNNLNLKNLNKYILEIK